MVAPARHSEATTSRTPGTFSRIQRSIPLRRVAAALPQPLCKSHLTLRRDDPVVGDVQELEIAPVGLDDRPEPPDDLHDLFPHSRSSPVGSAVNLEGRAGTAYLMIRSGPSQLHGPWRRLSGPAFSSIPTVWRHPCGLAASGSAPEPGSSPSAPGPLGCALGPGGWNGLQPDLHPLLRLRGSGQPPAARSCSRGQIAGRVAEALALGVRASFTSPAASRSSIPRCSRSWPTPCPTARATVLTNGTLFTPPGSSDSAIWRGAPSTRSSCASASTAGEAEDHERFRGAGSFVRTLEGIVAASRAGLLPIVTATFEPDQDPARWPSAIARCCGQRASSDRASSCCRCSSSVANQAARAPIGRSRRWSRPRRDGSGAGPPAVLAIAARSAPAASMSARSWSRSREGGSAIASIRRLGRSASTTARASPAELTGMTCANG